MKGWARPGRCVTGTHMQPGPSSGGPAFLPRFSPTFTLSIPLPAPLPQTFPDPGQVRKNPPLLTPLSRSLSPTSELYLPKACFLSLSMAAIWAG